MREAIDRQGHHGGGDVHVRSALGCTRPRALGHTLSHLSAGHLSDVNVLSRQESMQKPMMRVDKIRAWMVANVGNFFYTETPAYDLVGKVDATALYEGFLRFAGAHARPLNDEDHPAFWIAVDVAAEYDIGHE